METPMSTQEQQLCQLLLEMPARHGYRYTDNAERELLTALFWCMAAGKSEYMDLFFPTGGPTRPGGTLKLREAQGRANGAEYTEAARGRACGHIFKSGEPTYSCRTCSTDDTCCFCSKCFEATDHTNHMVRVSISPGNSGCCDCGDPEAWNRPVICTIHSVLDQGGKGKGKEKETPALPEDLVTNTRMTIGRVLDFICDVISCSPEQLRQVKTVESILQDERASRLSSTYCGGDTECPDEWAVLLWNDEKHTITDVRDQVARACQTSKDVGLAKAYETDSIGRSILMYDKSIEKLLEVANMLEKIRVTITIRSSRDTFREQMCGTMVEWLRDITSASVGEDHNTLRQLVCEEMLKPWRRGSPATHAIVGKDGIDDELLIEEEEEATNSFILQQARILMQARQAAREANREAEGDAGSEGEGEEDEDDGDDHLGGSDMDEDVGEDDDVVMLETREDGGDVAMQDWRQDAAMDEDEAAATPSFAQPPPPPPVQRRTARDRELTPSDSDTAEPLIAPAAFSNRHLDIPKTPAQPGDPARPPPSPGRYWLATPAGYVEQDNIPIAEDLFERVRLDWMILFDLRMWKKVRNDLRSLYISTVVTIPEFKRILGLRFAGLYTTLAQLYLIGDREPDHSIINLSLQMLTTPSITAEIVERGNFLTSLMAILYTFLTTRQVGHPWDVSSNAVLYFESGNATNRRMYHFFLDLKYLFSSPHVQERLRSEERYLLQFLDLVKLHQGVCPNVRAVVEHVEYETDTWISASLVTREINRLCRQYGEAFRNLKEQDSFFLYRAIRLTAQTVIINSIGAERGRFSQCEIRDEVAFKTLYDFEFEPEGRQLSVVKFVVEEEPISFHHGLHYFLSWLIECGRAMPVEQLRALVSFTTEELLMKPRSMGKKQMPRLGNYGPEDYLMAAFDFPLRVCAWLAQMKAGMWVRNGMSLRHQAGTYKGVTQRDLSHHRDIFMLQTALVVCDPSRVLASIVDRYGMEKWVKGIFEQKAKAQDDIQHLDVVEDMIHLLIVLLSDRTSLIPTTENSEPPHFASMRRDLAHVLCFKPLSFSDICAKLPDKFQEQEDFHKILEEMTVFKYPEGVSDVGTFELKPQYVETIDPYMAYYNKNQRDEAELAWRKCVAKKTGQPVEDVVYEPNLRPIPSGVFAGLAAFTNTGMFAQIVYYSLLYPLVYSTLTPQVPSTRVETFLGVVLHLILIAIAEDKSDESEEQASFIALALTRQARSNWLPDAPHAKTIVALLNLLATKDEFKACHPKINLILRRMRQKRPKAFDSSYERLGLSVEGMGTASPAAAAIDEERERKKKAALERQARVLAQFQAQQKSFMEKQGDIDWGEMDDLEDEELPPMEEHRNFWKYPSGTCILCQEDTDERRLYGTFAYFTESTILRQTDFQDPDFVREAAATPENLDRSAEAIRPFGVARENKETIWKVDQHGNLFEAERSLIGKGFPAKLSRCGPVAVGCGHIMHFHCFEAYFEATIRRHQQQIARHAPEKPSKNEFICPLCKALGNAFLPIIWKGKEESYPGPLVPSTAFSSFLEQQLHSAYYTLGAMRPPDQTQNSFAAYTSQNLMGNLADKSSQLLAEAWLDFTPSQGGVAEAANDFLAILSPQDQTSSRGRAPDPASAMKELVKVYRRLKDTLVKNGIESRHDKSEVLGQDANELCGSDVLARAVGFSISAIEIQQRGVEAEYGMTFIERIPTQVLTQLRILAESVTSYIAVGGQRESGENRIDTEFRKDSERQHCQLFISQYIGEETEHARSPVEVYAPLLSQDLFIFLCECVFGVIPAQGFEIAHMVRLCYLAEITKVAYHLARNIPAAQWFQNMSRKDDMDPSVVNFVAFCERLSQFDLEVSMVSGSGNDEPWSWENRAFQQPGLDTWDAWYSLLRKYALVFLRKCAILLHVKYGVDFNSRVSPCPEQRELERLTEALRVPSLDEMLTALSPERGIQHGWPVETPLLVSGWVRHQATWPYNGDAEGLPQSAVLSHPGIFELIGLPKNYDRLIDECTNLQCPTNGGELTDPNICLFCGEIFCGQAVCCMKEVRQERRRVMRIGGGQQHMQKCQKNIGIFINIRKCAVVYLSNLSGSFGHAPYIDRYGEMDMGLRYGRQLFLNQKRYDSTLRNLWLSHGVPTFIARKLEADINNGGWDTV